MQAFAACVIKDFDSNDTKWDLSWGCLTGVKAREALRNMKRDDPLFWSELTGVDPQDLPDSTKTLPEDCEPDTNLEDEDADDSNLPLQMLIDAMTGGDLPNDVSLQQDGTLVISLADAENIDLEPETASESSVEPKTETGQGRGMGKRRKIASRRYNSELFWRHNDGDDWRDDNLLL
jgi:hypothetical protein